METADSHRSRSVRSWTTGRRAAGRTKSHRRPTASRSSSRNATSRPAGAYSLTLRPTSTKLRPPPDRGLNARPGRTYIRRHLSVSVGVLVAGLLVEYRPEATADPSQNVRVTDSAVAKDRESRDRRRSLTHGTSWTRLSHGYPTVVPRSDHRLKNTMTGLLGPLLPPLPAAFRGSRSTQRRGDPSSSRRQQHDRRLR